MGIIVKKIKDDSDSIIYEFNYLHMIYFFIIMTLIIIIVSSLILKSNFLLKMLSIYLLGFLGIFLLTKDIVKYSKDLRKKISQGYTFEYKWKNRLCSRTTLKKI
jgi:hypothetical protein